MHWTEEKARVSVALDELLPTLHQPMMTLALGNRLSQITGLSARRCRVILGWLAQEGHPHATRDGGIVVSYGRNVMRWRWHPTPAGERHRLNEEKIARRLQEMGIVDIRDW